MLDNPAPRNESVSKIIDESAADAAIMRKGVMLCRRKYIEMFAQVVPPDRNAGAPGRRLCAGHLFEGGLAHREC